jgi:aspartate/methionine/tyrosine aminotransferase
MMPSELKELPELKPFKLERYFARFEFSAPHLLCCSDPESLTMKELVAMADTQSKGLWENLSLGYTESAGDPLLLQEIVKEYPSLSQEDVIALAPEEGIYLAMRTVLKPGDHVVAISPGYQSLTEIAESMGCNVSRWEPTELATDDCKLHFSVDQLESIIKSLPSVKLVVVNFPHNPTGCMLTAQEWERVVSLCKECNNNDGCYLFSDEMYRCALPPSPAHTSPTPTSPRRALFSRNNPTFTTGSSSSIHGPAYSPHVSSTTRRCAYRA